MVEETNASFGVVLPDIPSEMERSAWQQSLANRSYNFDTQIDKFIINSNARLLAVMRKSITNVVNEAQLPVYDGGRMRVKTGFLRASGGASLNALPKGISRGDKKGTYSWNADKLNLILGKMKIGDVFYFGWTADYAKYREAYDGFLESAAQNWQSHVDKAVAHFRNKDGGK